MTNPAPAVRMRRARGKMTGGKIEEVRKKFGVKKT